MIEPGIGYRLEKKGILCNELFSAYAGGNAASCIVTGDDRYERAAELLGIVRQQFSAADAMSVLESVRQEGVWATRATFVYSGKKNRKFTMY